MSFLVTNIPIFEGAPSGRVSKFTEDNVPSKSKQSPLFEGVLVLLKWLSGP